MKAIAFNGSPRRNGNTAYLLKRVLEPIAEAGIETRRPLELVAWTNEEGSRFQPGCMGSGVFGGQLALAGQRAVTDAAGIAVEMLRARRAAP